MGSLRVAAIAFTVAFGTGMRPTILIAQDVGGGRAGWYSWDWLDNNGEPSADRVVPDWQNLEAGRHLKGPTNWWSVLVLEPNCTLVLQSSYGLLTGRSFDPRSDLRLRVYAEGFGATTCGRMPAAGPDWSSVRGAGAARDCSPDRFACW
jgi:hypothetical protein